MAKPLVIAVHPDLLSYAFVAALSSKGHTMISHTDTVDELWQADLILAPQACRWLPGMEDYLDALIKGARAIKYPPKTVTTPGGAR